jgi:hypothetical protein
VRARRLAAGIAALVLGLAAAAPAQELSLAVAAGGYFASQEAYREIYGPGVTLAADVLFKLKGPFGIGTGFSRIADEGTAVPLDGGDEEYPLEFSRTTIPLILFYQFDIKKVDIRLGAGLGIHSYSETWQTVDLAFEGKKTSPRFVLEVSVALLDRVSLLCSARYDSIRTGTRSPLATDVELGGVQLLGGLSIRIL